METFQSRLLGAGLIIGVYAMIPAFFLGGLHVRRGVEVVDHAVPGMVVLAVVVLAILRGGRSETLMLVTGAVVLLAGFWMSATHTSLLSQALDHRAGAVAAAYHCSTALAVLVLGAMWVWRYRDAGSTPPARTPPPAERRR